MLVRAIKKYIYTYIYKHFSEYFMEAAPFMYSGFVTYVVIIQYTTTYKRKYI